MPAPSVRSPVPPSGAPFVRAARAAENEGLERWIAVHRPTMETQFARRLPPSRRPGDFRSSAALEQLTRPLSAALYPRRYALKNRERLNRLLMLMQLHLNGEDDLQAYVDDPHLA